MIEPFFTGKSVFDFDHIEMRIRNSLYHLGVGNQLTSCLAAVNVRCSTRSRAASACACAT